MTVGLVAGGLGAESLKPPYICAWPSGKIKSMYADTLYARTPLIMFTGLYAYFDGQSLHVIGCVGAHGNRRGCHDASSDAGRTLLCGTAHRITVRWHHASQE